MESVSITNLDFHILKGQQVIPATGETKAWWGADSKVKHLSEQLSKTVSQKKVNRTTLGDGLEGDVLVIMMQVWGRRDKQILVFARQPVQANPVFQVHRTAARARHSSSVSGFHLNVQL